MSVLTKSDFLEYRTCKKSFWLSKHKTDSLPKTKLDDFALMLMHDGFDVEHCVKSWALEWPDADSLTFQKTFGSPEGLEVRADMICYIDAATIDIFEIKSSTSERDHLEDVAFQTVAIERSGLSVNQINIIHVDKTYIRSGEIKPESLLVIADVTEKVREMIAELAAEIDAALDWIRKTQIDEVGCDCRYKGSIPNRCAAFDYLNPNIPDLSIYNLPNIRTGRVREFVEAGRLDLAQVSEGEVTPSMLPVLKAAHSGQAVINMSGIKRFLECLVFPLFFYDYETYKSAVPIMDGVSPHEQVLVQVSVHRLDTDGTLTHTEFLAEGPGQRYELALALRGAIEDQGSCISWHKSFEIGCNKRLGKAFPEFHDFMESINERTVDLRDVFLKDYVDIGFKGSTSIKSVLPVLCPQLSYEGMAVGNGGTAMAAWLSMSRETDPDTKIQKRDDLLEYCKLDTFAMVEIYRFLLGVMKP